MRLQPAVMRGLLLLFLLVPAASARAQDESYWPAYRAMNYGLSARHARYAAHFETSSPDGVCPCGNRAFHTHAAAVAGSAPWHNAAYESYSSGEPYTTGDLYSAGEPYATGQSYAPGEEAWVDYESLMPAPYGRPHGKIPAHRCRDKGPGPLWYFCHDMNVLFDSVLDDIDNLCCSVIYGFRDPCYLGTPWPSYVYGNSYPGSFDGYVPTDEVPWQMEGEMLEQPPEPPPVAPSVAPYSSSAGGSRQPSRHYAKRVDPVVPTYSVLTSPIARSRSIDGPQTVRASRIESSQSRDSVYAAQTASGQVHHAPRQSTWLGRPTMEQQASASMNVTGDGAAARGTYEAQLADAIVDVAESGPVLAAPTSPPRGASLRIVDSRQPEPTLAPVERSDRSDDEAPSTLRLFAAPPNPLRN